MNITLSPLPAHTSARSILPDTDPATGIAIFTARPSRHAWTTGQTILAALGARADVSGSGRRYSEDLALLHAWFTAHDVRTLVVRHATNLYQHNFEVLDDIGHLCSSTGTDLALTCDETTGSPIADWVKQHGGEVEQDDRILLDRLAHTARDTEGGSDPTDDPFPTLLPHADFYLFRARCREVLSEADFDVVDGVYCEAFRNVAVNPFASAEDASARLRNLVTGSDNVGRARTILRAAQAATFMHGQLLKVNLDFFLHAVHDGTHRRLSRGEVTALRAYRVPWRSVVTVLRDADIDRNTIHKLSVGNVAQDGTLVGVQHLPLLPDARTYLVAQRTLRILNGATDDDHLVAQSIRRIAEAQRAAAQELGLPIVRSHEPSAASQTTRWQHALGVTLLPLVGGIQQCA